MNLKPQAENEAARRTRSKLEIHREAIIELRRKHWTHRQIAVWLNERGVNITLSAVHRFCQRSIVRRPRGNNLSPSLPNDLESEPFSIPTPQTKNKSTSPTTTKTTNQYRFNLDI
jgi:hypothetical protein